MQLQIHTYIFAMNTYKQVELFGKLSKHAVLPSVVTRKLTHIFTGSSMLTLFALFPVGHS